MKTTHTRLTAAISTTVAMTAICLAGPAHSDPETWPCDLQQLSVAAGPSQAGAGHRAVQLNFTLRPDAEPCHLSGYPTVDAEVQGAATVHAKQTPKGYLGGADPGKTAILDPGRGAHAMVEWDATGTAEDPACPIYGTPDVRLQVIPPGMWQTFAVPISIGPNEGLCDLQVHPLASD